MTDHQGIQYEVAKRHARLFITVQGGFIVRAESPTHGCFDADFIGQPWSDVRKRFEDEGFTIHRGH
jgi:hypothetical protein